MTLLAYALSSHPAPLQVSTPQVQTRGRVNLAVFNPRNAHCDEISVSVYVGDDANAWGADPPSGSVSTNRWGLEDFLRSPEEQRAKYLFRCREPADYLIAYDLVLGLAGPLNQTTGQLDCTVAEHSGPDPASLEWSQPVSFAVDKVTPYFFVDNLVALPAGPGNVPATEFAAGQAFRLEWESNATWFEVYAKGSPKPVYAGLSPHCDIPGITTDTTFLLAAQGTGDPGSASEANGYEPVVLYDSITVTVANPVLTPASVNASGDVSGATINAGSASTSGTLSVGTDLDCQTVTVQTPAGEDYPGIAVLAQPNQPGQGATTAGAGYFQTSVGKNSVYTELAEIRGGDTEWAVGLHTNGVLITPKSTINLAQVPTSRGPRVVTTPLVVQPELHLSGAAQLSGGRAVVQFDDATADLLLHNEDYAYRVLVTPTARCGGLVVTGRTPAAFVVEEVSGGQSDATFDWLVITDIPAELGAAAPHRVPDTLPAPRERSR
jgi:hypothetical protein